MAHSLKSNGADFGVVALREAAATLEAQAAGGDLAQAAELAARMRAGFEGAVPMLTTVRATGRLP